MDYFDQARLERARTQRMFLIDKDISLHKPTRGIFRIVGTSGNIYTVTIFKDTTCDCPDFVNNQKFCKHVIFTFLKVLKADIDRYLRLQIPLGDRKKILSKTPNIFSSEIIPNETVIQKYHNLSLNTNIGGAVSTGIQRRAIEDCPICMESMTDDSPEKVGWCNVQCGNNFHLECYQRYAEVTHKGVGETTCVYCRAPIIISLPHTTKNIPIKATANKYMNIYA